MEDDWDELHSVVETIVHMLGKYGISDWHERLVDINNRIGKRWREGPSLLLELYGGMGSLTDLVIYPGQNDKTDKGDVRRTNEELKHALERAYILAKGIDEGG